MAAYDHNQGFASKAGKKEGPEAYSAFVTFCELGKGRNLRKVSQLVGTGYENIKRLSKTYNWMERAAAYDADRVRADFAAVRKEREDEHRAAIRRFRNDQERRSRALGELGDLMLEVCVDKVQSMRAAGEQISEQTLSNIAKTVSSLHEMSMNLGATALGIDDLESALEQELEE